MAASVRLPLPPSEVPGGVTVLLGGARSGKSSLAVEMATRWGGSVTFIATATAGDADMAGRIARHRAERPPWPTLEAPTELAGALHAVPADALAIVDCLTLWVTNLVLAGHHESVVLDRAAEAAATAARRPAPTVVISNEVGLGVVPATELGRTFQDVLGRVNQLWVSAADRALLLVAGRALQLRDPWDVLSWS